jgi:DNA-binding transcriptional MerR regulator/methylmalonyl-CoA mutase cobalamin-binding subunit
MVSKRTGLSPHVIRVWERRYGAVTPVRTPTNRRVYRDEDVERLQLLQQATLVGHTISQAAKLTNARLKALLKDTTEAVLPAFEHPGQVGGERSARATAGCMEAIQRMDLKALNSEFRRATLTLGTQGFLTQVAAPLGQQVGHLWRIGEITAAHEHFLSAALRDFLGHHSQQFAVPAHAPVILVATPAGQIHELGAILVTAAAANLGWSVVYLGTSLPAAEIAGAARQKRARVIALSIVYPEDDPTLPDELQRLKSYLPEGVDVIVGGRGASAYATALSGIGARVVTELEDVFPVLEGLRKRGPGAALKVAS